LADYARQRRDGYDSQSPCGCVFRDNLRGTLGLAGAPVAEVFYEREWGVAETVSGLAGAIWQINDKLAFDIALRDARVNGHTVNELRAGVTFGLPLW
jgi:hypothetical protein